MKFSFQHLSSHAATLALLLLQGAPTADGHYGFPIVILNGVVSEWWEFVRPVGLTQGGQQFSPLFTTDLDKEPIVCGINGTKTGHETGIAKVQAGDTIGFGVIPATYENGPITPRPWNPETDIFNHDGPGQAFMSKAPGALEDYEGDGDWFKIGTDGASDGMHWDSERDSSINFTIPATTPPGKYLVRVEHLNISPIYGSTQFFVNCAQVEVEGPGGGEPGPMAKFPGAYDAKDPGIWLPRAMYNPYKPSDLLKQYKGPGPVVWQG